MDTEPWSPGDSSGSLRMLWKHAPHHTIFRVQHLPPPGETKRKEAEALKFHPTAPAAEENFLFKQKLSFVMLGKEPLADNTSEGLEPWLLLMVTVGSLARLTRAPKATFCSGQQAQRTAHTSRMQKRARQVGQGTRLASQVSGRCGSWRLANHLPMQVRHHMGRQ